MNSYLATIPADEEPINIGFWVHSRLRRQAVERYGDRWSPTHDRWVAKRLFAEGHISESQRSQLLEKVSRNVEALRHRDPNYGRIRLW